MGCDLDHALINVSSKRLQELQDAFLRGIPFQYLLKFSEFYGHRFFVDERVLIPRPETEFMVERLMELKKKRGKPFASVLDVGTGSGVILLSLLKNDFAMMGMGADLSTDALEVAGVNAARLRLNPVFVQSDRLQNITQSFDVIVSNPPYIKEAAHLNGVHKSVNEFEPHLALYLKDEDYKNWFQLFFTQVYRHLNAGGIFWMEGHENEVESQTDQLKELGFHEVQVENDLTGRPRFIRAAKPA